MFRPGGFGMMPPIVKNLLILNALVFLLTGFALPGISSLLGMYFPLSWEFKPWQLVTHMFTHGDFFHFFFNMFALWMFGTVLENQWHGKRFFFYYFLCGFGAAVTHLAVHYFEYTSLVPQMSQEQIDYVFSEGRKLIETERNFADPLMAQLNSVVNIPVVGASGAIYGLLAAYGFLYPNNQLMLLFPPIPIRAKYFVLILIGIDLFAGLSDRPGDNVAHFAHLGGALFGLIALLYWRSTGRLYR